VEVVDARLEADQKENHKERYGLPIGGESAFLMRCLRAELKDCEAHKQTPDENERQGHLPELEMGELELIVQLEYMEVIDFVFPEDADVQARSEEDVSQQKGEP
jgi:hypothetical protein